MPYALCIIWHFYRTQSVHCLDGGQSHHQCHQSTIWLLHIRRIYSWVLSQAFVLGKLRGLGHIAREMDACSSRFIWEGKGV